MGAVPGLPTADASNGGAATTIATTVAIQAPLRPVRCHVAGFIERVRERMGGIRDIRRIAHVHDK
jgi:hypothetical protein